MKLAAVEPQFVDQFPANLESGILYVSMPYGTAAHKCCCGCGRKVITPFGPTDWKLIFDGDTVSLHPSIGNWNFPCRSHYWIRENRIQWAPQWTKEQIEHGRDRDALIKSTYFGGDSLPTGAKHDAGSVQAQPSGFWAQLFSAFKKRQ